MYTYDHKQYCIICKKKKIVIYFFIAYFHIKVFLGILFNESNPKHFTEYLISDYETKCQKWILATASLLDLVYWINFPFDMTQWQELTQDHFFKL